MAATTNITVILLANKNASVSVDGGGSEGIWVK